MVLISVPDVPFRRAGNKIKFSAFFMVFENRKFRAASFGYFGHMWEIYAFWAFIPIIPGTYNELYPEAALNVPLLSFAIIAFGGPCRCIWWMVKPGFRNKKHCYGFFSTILILLYHFAMILI